MSNFKNWDDKKLYTTFVELGEEIEALHDEYFGLLQRLLKDEDVFMFTDSIDYGKLKDNHRELLYRLYFQREMSLERILLEIGTEALLYLSGKIYNL